MKFDFKNDPFDNFLKSFQQAQMKGIPEHNAMALSTVSENKPSCRMVLYKGLVERGFSFYTNYNGRKGRELEKNKNVATVFYWPHLDHQIRIEGFVVQLSAEQSDQYFNSRARESQLGAWASSQSDKVDSYDEFQKTLEELQKRFSGQIIPRPPSWGGFKIIPLEIEFWFAHPNRLHQRFVYSRKSEQSEWERFLRLP